MNDALKTEKKRQRRLAREAREALTEAEREAFSRAVCQKLAAHPAVAGASVILSYMAFGSELDLTAFHEKMAQRGKILAFPVTRSDGRMEAYRPGNAEEWTAGAYGIRTPKEDPARHIEPEEIDIVVVPCLAFDESGMRLGWGGGYYDRYLPRCTKALSVGAAFEVQRLETIPADPDRDVRLDAVITERSDSAGG